MASRTRNEGSIMSDMANTKQYMPLRLIPPSPMTYLCHAGVNALSTWQSVKNPQHRERTSHEDFALSLNTLDGCVVGIHQPGSSFVAQPRYAAALPWKAVPANPYHVSSRTPWQPCYH